MAEAGVGAVRGYRLIATMWIRASLTYRTSFWIMAASNVAIGALDFVGIWIMFSAVDSLGGFDLHEIALLYGATGLGLATADMAVGGVERLGRMVRLGRLDAMMVRPVPLLAQVCAEDFALRRLARVVLMSGIFLAAATWVAWTPLKVVVAIGMVASAVAIFFALFVAFACIQFWTSESSEVANAFTYGGNTITQYPLTIFPAELAKTLTFLLPLAFVNWYPCLFLLDRPDPFGLPGWLQFASPVAAVLVLAVAGLAWRAGVRRYTSTGS